MKTKFLAMGLLGLAMTATVALADPATTPNNGANNATNASAPSMNSQQPASTDATGSNPQDSNMNMSGTGQMPQ